MLSSGFDARKTPTGPVSNMNDQKVILNRIAGSLFLDFSVRFGTFNELGGLLPLMAEGVEINFA